MKFGLKERELDEIVIFGSRARGDYNKVSDIDIAIKGDVDKIMYKIRDYFEESSIMYTVDVVNYISISNQDFKENIDNEGIIVNS